MCICEKCAVVFIHDEDLTPLGLGIEDVLNCPT